MNHLSVPICGPSSPLCFMYMIDSMRDVSIFPHVKYVYNESFLLHYVSHVRKLLEYANPGDPIGTNRY
jgi:hypothetical protein